MATRIRLLFSIDVVVLFTVAVESLQTDIVKHLIESGCDVNTVDNNQHSTALHRVVRYCEYKTSMMIRTMH